MKKHGINSKPTCTYCIKTFTTINSLKRHINMVHEREKCHYCNICSKSFFDASYLQIHIHAVHEGHNGPNCCRVKRAQEKQKSIENKCDICEKLFSSKHILKEHIAHVHDHANDGKLPKCNICNKLFPWGNLKRHTKWCKLRHYCHKCKQSFSNSQDFDEHIHKSHDELFNLYNKQRNHIECDICGKIFEAYSYKYHILKKHKEKRIFTCTTSPCEKSFSKLKEYVLHKTKIHSQGRGNSFYSGGARIIEKIRF